jgi:hypothetical protein
MERMIFKNKSRDIEKTEKRFMNFGLKFIMSLSFLNHAYSLLIVGQFMNHAYSLSFLANIAPFMTKFQECKL